MREPKKGLIKYRILEWMSAPTVLELTPNGRANWIS